MPLLHSSFAPEALSAGYGLRPAFWPQGQFASHHTPIREEFTGGVPQGRPSQAKRGGVDRTADPDTNRILLSALIAASTLEDFGRYCGNAPNGPSADRDNIECPRDEPNELVADRAYKVARSRFAVWNGGDIEDPEVVRERAVRLVISEFEKAQQRAYKEGRYIKTEEMMTDDLRNALGEFEIVMGGMPA